MQWTAPEDDKEEILEADGSLAAAGMGDECAGCSALFFGYKNG